MTTTQDRPSDKPPAPGEDPASHTLAALGRIERGVRLTLYRLLAVPLVLALLLALHPWTWGGSSHSGTADYGYDTSTPYATATDDSGSGDYPGDSDTTDSTDDSDGSGDLATESPTDDPQAEAGALDALITQSADSRSKVSAAVSDAESCGSGLSEDVTALQDAADSRSSLAQQAGELTMDAVTGGPDAAQLLGTALSQSADADADYARWAQSLADGDCTAGATHSQSDYVAGGQDSTTAQQDKSDFVDAWNPIAAQYGLATRSPDEF